MALHVLTWSLLPKEMMAVVREVKLFFDPLSRCFCSRLLFFSVTISPEHFVNLDSDVAYNQCSCCNQDEAQAAAEACSFSAAPARFQAPRQRLGLLEWFSNMACIRIEELHDVGISRWQIRSQMRIQQALCATVVSQENSGD